MKRSPTSMARLNHAESPSSHSAASSMPNPEYASIITADDIKNYSLLNSIALGADFVTWQTIHDQIQRKKVSLIELLALRTAITGISWKTLSNNNRNVLIGSIDAALERHYRYETKFNVVIMWPPAHPELAPEHVHPGEVASAPSLVETSMPSQAPSAATLAAIVALDR